MIDWPEADQVFRVVLLRDHNTRVVLLGTSLLGATAGVVGSFMLLRKRALVGDVVAHAALPGIALAFILLEGLVPGAGRFLPALLAGAVLAGLAAMGSVLLLRRVPRIKEDAALAIVLSVFFGLGIVLLTVVQGLPTGTAAGLNHYIYGKAALMLTGDVWFIAAAALATLLTCGLLYKELSLLCFDESFAAAAGWPVIRLDAALMALIVAVTVIGLQSVGLLLVVAMLILPPAAARFWSDRLATTLPLAAVLGGMGAALGVLLSALFPRLAAGPVIVLSGTALFGLSMVCGLRHGLLPRAVDRRRVRRRVGRHDLMRAAYECVEHRDERLYPLAITATPLTFEDLRQRRRWSPRRLRRLLAAALAEGLLKRRGESWYLTRAGAEHARRATRNHRLWELYMVHYAEVAPSQIDRHADAIEHVLDPETVRDLERLLGETGPRVPPSPHAIRETQ